MNREWKLKLPESLGGTRGNYLHSIAIEIPECEDRYQILFKEKKTGARRGESPSYLGFSDSTIEIANLIVSAPKLKYLAEHFKGLWEIEREECADLMEELNKLKQQIKS